MTNHFDAVLVKELEVRWRELLESYHIEPQIGALIFQDILTAYSEPHRHYHNLNHLNHMFQELDTYEADSREIDSASRVTNEMLWAVWYHDIVYKPGASSNEKKSAIKAKESMLQLNIQQSSIDKVVALIMATKNHQTNTGDISTQVFLDADMAILGSDEDYYLKYRDSVRREHANIPDFLFNRGRKKFLSQTLKQSRIFMSSFFYDKYEQIARKNIDNELSN
jgi:predicted metal-dependent HD superfamily phosphohydrolase